MATSNKSSKVLGNRTGCPFFKAWFDFLCINKGHDMRFFTDEVDYNDSSTPFVKLWRLYRILKQVYYQRIFFTIICYQISFMKKQSELAFSLSVTFLKTTTSKEKETSVNNAFSSCHNPIKELYELGDVSHFSC